MGDSGGAAYLTARRQSCAPLLPAACHSGTARRPPRIAELFPGKIMDSCAVARGRAPGGRPRAISELIGRTISSDMAREGKALPRPAARRPRGRWKLFGAGRGLALFLSRFAGATASDRFPAKMTPTLIAIAGSLKGTTFALPEGETTIGREPSNVICLNDQSVSRRHCVVRREA